MLLHFSILHFKATNLVANGNLFIRVPLVSVFATEPQNNLTATTIFIFLYFPPNAATVAARPTTSSETATPRPSWRPAGAKTTASSRRACGRLAWSWSFRPAMLMNSARPPSLLPSPFSPPPPQPSRPEPTSAATASRAGTHEIRSDFTGVSSRVCRRRMREPLRREGMRVGQLMRGDL